MRFPWPRLEKRQAAGSYTDSLIRYLAGEASGDGQSWRQTGALEAVAGAVGRAFASAEISGPSEITTALTPACLSMVGRSLIRDGEIVLLISVKDGMLKLRPSSQHDIQGGPDPEDWRYRIDFTGPDSQTTITDTPYERVLHFMYSQDPRTLWRGRGPLEVAATAASLSGSSNKMLAEEMSGARGQLLPTPKPGDDPTMVALRADLKNAKGGTLLVESMASDWQSGSRGQSPQDWVSKRLGPDIPSGNVDLRKDADMAVLAACGVSAALFQPSQGTAAREAWRQFLFGVVAPLGKTVLSELRMKLGAEIGMTWEELRASDLSGRARAFQSMVASGMDLDRAAQISGLMEPED